MKSSLRHSRDSWLKEWESVASWLVGVRRENVRTELRGKTQCSGNRWDQGFPRNPNRPVQRKGRIDRYRQTKNALINHFVSERYRQKKMSFDGDVDELAE